MLAVLLVLLVACLGLGIWEDMKDPIPITPEQVGRYEDEKVRIVLNVTERVGEGTKLDFLMPIFITQTSGSGQYATTTTTVIFVPLFEDYDVFATKEGIFLAIDKDRGSEDVPLGAPVDIVGYVRKEKNSERYAIAVS